ncbi:MAG: hypothetical protein H0U49_13040 [Parachlamydiaceae bacterium]|nr:hypothetical protein [Parachlamydiaceae bacterium]
MIRHIFVVSLFLLPLTATLNGLLPPLYQTADEIAAVVKEHELGNVLPDGEPIVGIQKIDKGYLVITNKHQVEATIVYEPAARPGPARFKVKFQIPEKTNGMRDSE